jgi:ankyrin repeat protein
MGLLQPLRRSAYGAAIAALVVCGAAPRVRADDARLIDLVRAGDVTAAKRWIASHKRDVDQPASDGSTALHWAAQAGQRELVTLLLAAGANANAPTRLGVPPLLPAVVRGDAAIVRALVRAGARSDAPLPNGQTLLMLAARTGDPATLRVLIEGGADVNAAEPAMGETALMWAAAENHADAVRTLLSAGARVDTRSAEMAFSRDKFGDGRSARFTVLPRGGWTALMYAARQDSPEAVRALAAAGADLNATDPDGTTALVLAVINAHYELAAQLLDAGANPNAADVTGMTPLYAAVDMQTLDETPGRPAPAFPGAFGPLQLQRRLLERGARPDAALTRPLLERVHNNPDGGLGAGATPLMRAARKGDLASMRILLDGGADANARTARGATPLMYLAGFGGQIRFSEYDTHRATDAQFVDGMKLALARGAGIDAVDESGQTALHVAVAQRGVAVVAYLLERGARTDLADAQGRTALDIALGRGGRGARWGRPGRPHRDGRTASTRRTLSLARHTRDEGMQRRLTSVRRSILGLAVVSAALAGGARATGQGRPAYSSAEWGAPGGDWAMTRYSTLTQIDTSNVSRLGGAWSVELPPGQVSKAPLMVKDGRMFAVTSQGTILALDPATGETRWTYQPETPFSGNRGIGIGNGMLFAGQRDSSVIAIRAGHGKARVEIRAPSRPAGAGDQQRSGLRQRRGRGRRVVRRQLHARARARHRRRHGQASLELRGGAGSRAAGARDVATGQRIWKYGGGAIWTTPSVDAALGPGLSPDRQRRYRNGAAKSGPATTCTTTRSSRSTSRRGRSAGTISWCTTTSGNTTSGTPLGAATTPTDRRTASAGAARRCGTDGVPSRSIAPPHAGATGRRSAGESRTLPEDITDAAVHRPAPTGLGPECVDQAMLRPGSSGGLLFRSGSRRGAEPVPAAHEHAADADGLQPADRVSLCVGVREPRLGAPRGVAMGVHHADPRAGPAAVRADGGTRQPHAQDGLAEACQLRGLRRWRRGHRDGGRARLPRRA